MKTCSEKTREELVKDMAEAIWNNTEWRGGECEPGVCRFCKCELPYVYHVTSGGETYNVKRGTKMEARAIEILNATVPQDSMVMPMTLCDAMCEHGVHQDAQAEALRWRQEWRAKQEAKDAPEKPDMGGVGGSWGE